MGCALDSGRVRLGLVHGQWDSTGGSAIVSADVMMLEVPNNVVRCRSLEMVPSARCELYAIFQNRGDDVIVARYPPSIVAILSRSPELLSPTLEKIRHDDYHPSHLAATDNDFETLSEVDAYHLHRLFYPPSGYELEEHDVMMALSTVVKDLPPFERGLSLPQKVYAAMQEWRRRDDMTTAAKNRRNETEEDNDVTDVYYALTSSQQPKRKRSTDDNTTPPVPFSDISRHIARYASLFSTIHSSLTSILTPLSLVTLPTHPTHRVTLLRRCGPSALLGIYPPKGPEFGLSPKETLDKKAWDFLGGLEGREELRALRRRAAVLSREGLLVRGEDERFEKTVERLMKRVDKSEAELVWLGTTFSTLSEEEQLAWGSCIGDETLRVLLPGLNLTQCDVEGVLSSSGVISGDSEDAILVARGLCHALINTLRRMSLAKYLLLAHLLTNLDGECLIENHVATALSLALKCYLTWDAVAFVTEQKIAVEESSLVTSNSSSPSETLPRIRKRRIGKYRRVETSVLNAILSLHNNQTFSFSEEQSCHLLTTTTRALHLVSFFRNVASSETLPTLLRTRWKDCRSTLRLLAPSVPFPSDSQQDAILAECLLAELAHVESSGVSSSNETVLEEGRKRAIEIHRRNRPSEPITGDYERVYEMFTHNRPNNWTLFSEGSEVVKKLPKKDYPTPVPSLERLLSNQTSPLSHDIDPLLQVFSQLSHNLHLLTLFERYATHSHALIYSIAHSALENLSVLPSDLLEKMSEGIMLQSLLFRTAMNCHDFGAAFKACRNHRCKERGWGGFKLMIRDMIEEGYLDDLLGLEFVSGNEDGMTEWREGMVGVLKENGYREALYSVYAVREEWDKASEVLREMEDGVLGCVNALRIDSGGGGDGVLKGEGWKSGGVFDDMAKAASSQEDTVINKRMLDDSRKELGDDDDAAATRTVSLRSLRDMTLDASVATSLKLLRDESTTPDYEELTPLDVMERLASMGEYTAAVSLANVISSSGDYHTTTFEELITRLLCRYVAPLATAYSRRRPISSSTTLPSKPRVASILQSSFHRLSHYVTRGAPRRRRSQNDDDDDNECRLIGHAATVILQHYLSQYGTSQMYLSVAETVLTVDGNRAVLPLFITKALLGETIGSGSFAVVHRKKKQPIQKTITSHPAGLMMLYLRRGLYVAACDVVVRVLIGDDDGEKRRFGMAGVVPETGDGAYFVPYQLIDLLYEVAMAVLDDKRNVMSDKGRGELKEALKKMEKALVFHYECVKVVEKGLMSARALRGKEGRMGMIF